MIEADMKTVPGYPGLLVSRHGNVARVTGDRARPVKPRARAHDGALVVETKLADGRSISVLVGRLVLLAFTGPPPWADAEAEREAAAQDAVVRFLDGDGRNPALGNVQWETRAARARRTGRYLSGGAHPQARLSDGERQRIAALVARGRSRGSLAREYGVAPSTIGRIAAAGAPAGGGEPDKGGAS